MFKQRFLTAVILIPLVLLCIYAANDIVLLGVLSVLSLTLGWEWTQLIPLQKPGSKIAFLLGLPLSIWAVTWIFPEPWMVQVLSGFWAILFILIATYPASKPFWAYRSVVMVCAWFLIALFVCALWGVMHKSAGRDLLVYALCLVWATDIGAYFIGKRFGRHRLIPQVSPGKTKEGLLGGFVFTLLVACLGAWYFQPSLLVFWFLKALILSVLAVLGDLLISMLKRRSQVKDTGHILPGHGGILDRLDSLIAVLPIFYYFFNG